MSDRPPYLRTIELTKKQKQALEMARRADDSGDCIFLTSGASLMSEGEAFINYRTAFALEQRELLEVKMPEAFLMKRGRR